MRLNSWSNRRRPATSPVQRSCRPQLEALEARLVPSLSPHLLKDINPGATSFSRAAEHGKFTSVGTLTFFSADDGTHGIELWKSDGSAAGTQLVKDIYPGFTWLGSLPHQLTN